MRNLLWLLLLFGCSRPLPDPVPPVTDAMASETGWDVYSQACLNLDHLGCPEAHPDPDAGTCYETFRHAQESGLVNLAPGCVADAGSKGAVRACSAAWKRGCP